MTRWTPEELDAIGAADELNIAPVREDGTLRSSTTIWVVRIGDDLYVRSYHGRSGSWFGHVLASDSGRIRAEVLSATSPVEEPADADPSAIDDAYRRKYARRGRQYVDAMVSPNAAAATLRLVPR
jgi:hypothetical protein